MFLIIAALISASALAALALSDPKRLRTPSGRRHGKGVRHRGVLALLALLPGIALLFANNASDFLIWLGSVTLLGWLLARLLAGSAASEPR